MSGKIITKVRERQRKALDRHVEMLRRAEPIASSIGVSYRKLPTFRPDDLGRLIQQQPPKPPLLRHRLLDWICGTS